MYQKDALELVHGGEDEGDDGQEDAAVEEEGDEARRVAVVCVGWPWVIDGSIDRRRQSDNPTCRRSHETHTHTKTPDLTRINTQNRHVQTHTHTKRGNGPELWLLEGEPQFGPPRELHIAQLLVLWVCGGYAVVDVVVGFEGGFVPRLCGWRPIEPPSANRLIDHPSRSTQSTDQITPHHIHPPLGPISSHHYMQTNACIPAGGGGGSGPGPARA
jgi:hypothetical protein